MFAAELVEAPENRADPIEWLPLVRLTRFGRLAEQREPLLGEGEEDVVLAGEVPINRGGAVLDFFRDLADGDVWISFADEQLARRVQDGAADCLAIAFLSFFDPHEVRIAERRSDSQRR